jgi:phosphoglycerol transferase
MGLGFFDQTPANMGAAYAGVEAAYTADDVYFQGIEAELSPGAMVLLLPQIPFPESSSVTGQLASAQLIPFLHTNSLRWTNGGIKGRPAADWPTTLAAYGADRVAELAALAGCDGVLVDRSASIDSGAELEAAIRAATGAAPIVDSTGRFAFYDIARYRAGVEGALSASDLARERSEVLNPVVAYPSPGFHPGLTKTGEEAFIVRTVAAEFSLVNDAQSSRQVRLTFDVLGAAGDTAIVTSPNGRTITAELVGDRLSIDEIIDVPVGRTLVGVTVNPGPAGTLGAEISTPSVIDLGLADLLTDTGPLVDNAL